jgi:hypothetical protein
MALEALRPLLGAGFYMKIRSIPKQFSEKKLFCVQTLTKLTELKVFFL